MVMLALLASYPAAVHEEEWLFLVHPLGSMVPEAYLIILSLGFASQRQAALQ